MIAKRIPREKGTSSAARLVKYMVAAQGKNDPQTWKRTADYILETDDKTNKGERVGSYRVTNCETDDPAAATVLIEATQAINSRSKNDKTYHLVFSFPPGENPPLKVLHEIEDHLIESIGYKDHQRISAVHIDTNHLHVHVAINKVHPTGFQNIEPYYDQKRLMEACEHLEIKYNLQRTNHGINENERIRVNERSRKSGTIELNPAQRPELRDSKFRRYLRESYNLTFAEERSPESFNNLRTLSSRSLDGAAQRTEMLLQSNALASLERGGKASVHSLRREGTSNRGNTPQNGGLTAIDEFSSSEAIALGAFDETALSEIDAKEAQEPKGKAADIEKHSGLETLTGYVAREVAPAIREAKSWQEVHEALSEHGLLMTERGAGLIIGDPELPLWARASKCSRDLSLKSLTDRFGPFEKSKKIDTKPNKKFIPKPRQTHPKSAALFAQYQREKQENIAARRSGFINLKAEDMQFKSQLAAWTKTQRTLLKMSPKGAAKKIMSATITQQANASRLKHQKAMAEKREELFKRTSTTTWAEWLCKEAESGNLDALDILRSREQKEAQFKADLLSAENTDKAKTYILQALKPQARNDGSMSYRTADGGLVVDRASHVKAEKATTGAAMVALELASKRFEGQALIVEGSEVFKQEVAQLAGLHKLNIHFADPEMERVRQSILGQKSENNLVKNEVKTPKKENLKDQEIAQETVQITNNSLVDFINERNKIREKLSSIDYHKLWTSEDAGSFAYEGRRRLKDGSEVLLLKRNNEIFVKPASERMVAKASKWKVGSPVQLDARGRFVGDKKVKSNGIEL